MQKPPFHICSFSICFGLQTCYIKEKKLFNVCGVSSLLLPPLQKTRSNCDDVMMSPPWLLGKGWWPLGHSHSHPQSFLLPFQGLPTSSSAFFKGSRKGRRVALRVVGPKTLRMATIYSQPQSFPTLLCGLPSSFPFSKAESVPQSKGKSSKGDQNHSFLKKRRRRVPPGVARQLVGTTEDMREAILPPLPHGSLGHLPLMTLPRYASITQHFCNFCVWILWMHFILETLLEKELRTNNKQEPCANHRVLCESLLCTSCLAKGNPRSMTHAQLQQGTLSVGR